MRAPQGCLRVWVRRLRPTLREQDLPSPATWILPGLPEYTQASEFTSSRLPTYSLVKELVAKVLRQQPLQVHPRPTFSGRPAEKLAASQSGEAESYRPFRPCQSTPAEIFVQPSRRSHRPSANHFGFRFGSTVIRRRGPTGSPFRSYFSKGVARSNRRFRPTNAAVQAPRPDSESLAGVKTRPTQRGDNIPALRRLSSPVGSFSPDGGLLVVNVALTLILRHADPQVHSATRRASGPR